ncbi:TolC family protein [Xanthovirga aplysinae]|uniref:TolC family protein n=1 Tax=Xanthovirga aplysinae TaxID=2529853 RepID=UPI001656ADC0|nr:TolC family protein [Xanthovirga aplysinae]
MKLFKKYVLAVGLLVNTNVAIAQETLTKEQAVSIALENNYEIKVASNNVKIAENNAGILNSGMLPQVSANAGANLSNNDTEVTTMEGQKRSLDGLTSQSYNASIGVNYTLFDGMGRAYNYRKLQESQRLSELDARQIIENTLLSLFTSYYEVARLMENENRQKQTLETSNQRLLRAKYNYEYGQGSKLDLLNAEVDVNRDSIDLMEIRRQLINTKRDLNVILGRDVNVTFEVDTTVRYTSGLSQENLLANAKEKNVELLKARKNRQLNEYDVKISQTGWVPKVSLNGSYGWSQSENANVQFPRQSTVGLSANLNMAWNIFDGGKTRTNVQNAKIAVHNREIQQKQFEQIIERNVNNAWSSYQNALFILRAEEKNVQTNELNFERSLEQYKLGQINSIQFRDAQLNLLNAQNSFNQAKYEAKKTELQLLQLSGNLLNSEF